jgi:hypothetical protein
MAGGWVTGSLMMKRFAIAVLGAGSLAAMSVSAMADTADFTVTATTQAALSVTCADNLRFGTIGVEPTNAEATITVAASSGATASSSNLAAVYPEGTSGPAACTVTSEEGGDATASLAGTDGTFAGTTLSGLTLASGANTLTADVELSKATAIGNETFYIGGVLTIPASHTNYGTYTETVTLTVTD